MNMQATEKKAERKSTTDRKDALIAATLKCLSEEGHDGLSIRKICAEAGVSVGLINHHFSSKEDLVAQTYESLARNVQVAMDAEIEAAGDDPRKQLSAAFRSFLAPQLLDMGLLRAWLVFWGMIQPGSDLQRIYDWSYEQNRAMLETRIHKLAVANGIPMLDIRLIATGLLALLDGLWIGSALSPAAVDRQDALRLAEAWIDALVLGTGTPAPKH